MPLTSQPIIQLKLAMQYLNLEVAMLWTIFAIFVVLWLSGLVGGVSGLWFRYWSGSLLRR
jgi:hypothetical protein